MMGILFLSVIGVALFTMAATAVRAVSRLWLRHWIEHQRGGVRAMARFLDRPVRLVHTAGTASMLLVSAAGAAAMGLHGERPLLVVRDLGGAFLTLVLFGQLLPRSLGRRWAPRLVPSLVPLLHTTDLLLRPFHSVAELIRRAVRRRTTSSPGVVEKEGIEELLRDGAFETLNSTEELEIISGVVQFGDKLVRDVMTARDAIFAVDEQLGPAQLAMQVAQSGYSRVPVYRGSLDEVVGMVHVFDVFRRAGESAPPLRAVTGTTPDRPAKELLFSLLRARRQLAIVTEHGVTCGLVSLEDLLEELVGDIRDEHDDSGE